MTRRGGKHACVLLAAVLSAIGSRAPVLLRADAQNPPPTNPPQTTAPPQPPTPAAPTPPAGPAFEVAWETAFDAKSPVYVAAAADLVFTTGPHTPVVARRATDGTEVWQATTGSEIEPVVGDGVLVLHSSERTRALELASGVVRWDVANAAAVLDGQWMSLGGFGAFSGAALPLPMDAQMTLSWTSGSVLVAAGRRLRALRSADGTESWRLNLPAPILGRAVADEGRVFVTLADRTLQAVDLATGTVAWRQPLAATPGPLEAAAGQVYFGGSNGMAYAFRQSDGRRMWFFPRHAPAAGVPAADDRHAYFVLLTNEVVALDRETGNERWDERLTARLSNGIKAAGGALFLTVGDGSSMMLQATTGAVTTIRAAPPPEERRGGVHVESFDVSPDGVQVYLLTEVALKYKLLAYRKK
jgi:outer membrane protein assembly factor BamB